MRPATAVRLTLAVATSLLAFLATAGPTSENAARSVADTSNRREGAEDPEEAVRAFYEDIGRQDYPAAHERLTDEVRTRVDPKVLAEEYRGVSGVRVDESRIYGHAGWHWPEPDREPGEAAVYVRLSTPGEDAGSAGPSLAGTWRLRRSDAGWRLLESQLRPFPPPAELAGALPPDAEIEATALGDLRGTGADDVAVMFRVRADGYPRLALLLRDSGGWRAVDPNQLPGLSQKFKDALSGLPWDVRIEDVNGDGRAELVYATVFGAHSSALAILGWDGAQFVSLGRGTSNTFYQAGGIYGVGLSDLDRDGVDEVVFPYASYCGGYAMSPDGLTFVLRWRGGAYRPATLDFPELNGQRDIDRIRERLDWAVTRTEPHIQSVVACLEHWQATALAIQGRPREAWEAYQRHAARSPDWPAHVGLELFTATARDLLHAAESGQVGSWGPSELAILHDLIGNSNEDAARRHGYGAEWAEKEGKPDEAAIERAAAERERQAALSEYRAALALDSSDIAAGAGLSRLAR